MHQPSPMRLVAISDLHGSVPMLPRILGECGTADVVLLPGDITDFGTPQDASDIVAVCRETGAEMLAVVGNCDDEEIEHRLESEGCSISRGGRIVDGVGFFGVPSASVYMGPTWEVGEEELEGWIHQGYRRVRGASRLVMVPHAPPYGCVDRCGSGVPGGSRAVRAAVEGLKPILVVSGHIHEARGIGTLGGATVVNCGLGGRGEYAIAEIGEQVAVRLCSVGDR